MPLSSSCNGLEDARVQLGWYACHFSGVESRVASTVPRPSWPRGNSACSTASKRATVRTWTRYPPRPANDDKKNDFDRSLQLLFRARSILLNITTATVLRCGGTYLSLSSECAVEAASEKVLLLASFRGVSRQAVRVLSRRRPELTPGNTLHLSTDLPIQLASRQPASHDRMRRRATAAT